MQRSSLERLGKRIEQLEKAAIELKQAEATAYASVDRFRALLVDISDVVYCMSPDCSEMRQLAGRDFIPDMSAPSQSWLVSYIPPEDQPHVTAAINEAIRTKGCFELEHRVLRVDGTPGWTLSRAVPILDAQGEILEWLGIASDVTARKEAEQQLEERSLQLARLAEELTLAEHRERQRIAQHLHDHLQQLLVAARLRAHGVDSQEGPQRAEALAGLVGLLDEAHAATRNLVQDIAPPLPLARDPAEAFLWLLYEAGERHQLEVEPEIEIEDALDGAPEAISVLLFTAARELLFNVVKHAGTRCAKLRLRRHGQTVVLEVSDEGCGFDPSLARDKPYGFGLFSIRERVELLGGRFSLDSAPDRGCRVVLTIPLSRDLDAMAGARPREFSREHAP